MNIVVIGGGPAGSAAALKARQEGAEVTIVERSQFPRYRPGETLHPGIEPLLQSLDAADILHHSHYIRHPGIWAKRGGQVTFMPFGEDARGTWRGFQVNRGEFDKNLLDLACLAGASLCSAACTSTLRDADGGLCGVETTTGAIQSDLIIDCSGSSRFLSKELDIQTLQLSPQLIARYGYAYGKIDDPSPLIVFDKFGWTWIAEVALGQYQWTRVTLAKDRPNSDWRPPQFELLRCGPSRGADVSWRLASCLAGPGYFLAGDAAMTLDPSSSHGVLRGIMSGMMAAHLAIAHIDSGRSAIQCSRYYQKWLNNWFESDATEMRKLYAQESVFKTPVYN